MNYKVTVDGKEIEYGAFMIERCGSIEDLKNEMIEYFGVDQ